MKRRAKTPLKPKQVVISIAICAFVCLAGIGYIWAKAQVYTLGREIKALETQLEELKRTNALLRQSYATLSSPRELDLAVRRLNLGLVMPRPDQIVRMEDPAATAAHFANGSGGGTSAAPLSPKHYAAK